MSAHYCSECGYEVRRYVSLFGEQWMHEDASEGAECNDVRGDRTPMVVEAPELGTSTRLFAPDCFCYRTWELCDRCVEWNRDNGGGWDR